MLVAVSIDDREKQLLMIERVAEEHGRTLDFPLLSDPEHAVIDRYGLRNENDPGGRPIPHPATFVIDRDGRVRWKVVETDYRLRPSNEDILAALEAVQAGR